MADAWKKCTECRNDIAFGANYYQCSVSTCNRARMPLVFCSVVCWDCHLSSVRHRDAGAIEAKAPSKAQWEKELADNVQEQPTVAPPGARPTPPPPTPITRPKTDTGAGVVAPVTRRADETRPNVVPPMPAADPQRRVITPGATPSAAPSADGPALSSTFDKDVLIVVSKLKKYIKDRSGFNTSDQIMDLLSDHVRAICDEAIRCAARDDRKTVLERDMPRPPRR